MKDPELRKKMVQKGLESKVFKIKGNVIDISEFLLTYRLLMLEKKQKQLINITPES
jgi:hypothetical protein